MDSCTCEALPYGPPRMERVIAEEYTHACSRKPDALLAFSGYFRGILGQVVAPGALLTAWPYRHLSLRGCGPVEGRQSPGKTLRAGL